MKYNISFVIQNFLTAYFAFLKEVFNGGKAICGDDDIFDLAVNEPLNNGRIVWKITVFPGFQILR
ncbi:MAG: hypothetical protein D6799_00255 [Bacteroidetes bacterium]|nr:MAG: hypothetical protein D6799_00255 [Bacteroidota bacterium]